MPSRPANRARKRKLQSEIASGELQIPEQMDLEAIPERDESIKRKEFHLAQQRELETLQMKKLALNRADIEPAWMQIANTVSNRFQGLGHALAVECARSNNPREIQALIDSEVHKILTGLMPEQAPGT